MNGARTLAVLACLGIALAAPAAASAADNTIDFSAQPNGTALSSQYQSQDVTFSQSPGGLDSQVMYVEPPGATPPTSGAKVAALICGAEACRNYAWFALYPAMNHVSMWMAAYGASSASVTVTAFDGSGGQVTSDTTTVSDTSFTPMSVSAPGSSTTIAYIEITANDGIGGEGFEFTDLSYGPYGSPPSPDFGLVGGGQNVGVVAGGSGSSATITLRRYGGSSGAIGFSDSGLPSGVSLQISPNPDNGGDLSTATATFTASPGAPSVTQVPVTITGTPETPAAGSASHSLTIPVTVQATYGLRIQGIELTQGIQTLALPTRASPSAAARYSGVQLVFGKPTVVRVYADAPNAPPGGVAGTAIALSGYDASGHPLPGSPLGASAALSPPSLIDSGSSTVPSSERDSPNGSYWFVLPPAWLSDLATLTATLIPPTGSFGTPSAAVPCTDPACVAQRTFTLTGIPPVVQTGTTAIDAVGLAVNGKVPNIFAPFWWASNLLPTSVFADGDAGTIDITWISQGCPDGIFGKLCPQRSAQNSVALGAVEDFASNYDNGQGPAMAGVTTQNLGVENGDIFGSGNEPVAVVDSNRPVTDVAHEIGHMFGLPHAGAECGGGQDNDSDDTGQTGEPWPPDSQGYIDGIGLDLYAPGGPPYPVIYAGGGSYPTSCSAQSPPECGGQSAPQFFDFMSYCEAFDPRPDGTLGGTNAWISVRNWDYIAAYASCELNGGSAGDCQGQANAVKAADCLAIAPASIFTCEGLPFARRAADSAGPKATIASGPGEMRVYGYASAHGSGISVIDPTPTLARIAGIASPYSLELVGHGGRVLARSTMVMTVTHVDGVGPVDLLEGAIPARRGTTSLAILDRGKIVASRRRPRHQPHVNLLAPRAHPRVRGSLVVRWHATDPDGVHLIVSIDFSADGGHTWRTVYEGPNRGHVTIPRMFLAGTDRARVRLRVSDTFDQVTVISSRFVVTAAPPRVTIISPGSASAVRSGATLLLSGVGFDDAGHPLTGSALTWSAGSTQLGTGSELLATLPAGTRSITLTARDRQGHVGRETLPAPVHAPKRHRKHRSGRK